MDEKVTEIVLRLVCIKWGNLNWDKAFCNKVGLILRNFGFRLPKRGRTPGYQRDWAKILRDKASSYRNKIDSGLYKNIFVIGPDDMTDALKRLVSKGLHVTIDENRASLLDQEVIADKTKQLQDLQSQYTEAKNL